MKKIRKTRRRIEHSKVEVEDEDDDIIFVCCCAGVRCSRVLVLPFLCRWMCGAFGYRGTYEKARKSCAHHIFQGELGLSLTKRQL